MKKILCILITLLTCQYYCMANPNVWVMPCTELPEKYIDYPVQNEPYTIVLGKGETEHVQIVLTTIPKESITLSGNTIADNGLSMNFRRVSKIDKYQDALVPFTTSCKAESKQTALWVTFETTREAKPGTYEYTVNVKSIKSKAQIKFNVRIANYEIPLTPSIPSEFCLDIDNLPDNGSDKQKELWTEFLLDRRIDPYYSKIIDRSQWLWDSNFSPWAWDDPRSQKLLEDKRFVRFCLPFSMSDEETTRMCNDMKAKGLFDRCYFYLFDEPKTPVHYTKIATGAKRLHQIAPEAKVLVPISSYLTEGEHKWDYDYTFNYLRDYVDIYPISAAEYRISNSGAENFRNYLEPNGREWWTYVCCAPKGIEPNFLLEQTPFNHRAIMWRVWKEEETGFLYWGVNRYRMNPFAFDYSLDAPGDGGLVFPGQLFGLEEPIASVRLERWKEGQEDYEMLNLVSKKAGRKVAERLLDGIYKAPNDYTRSAQAIEEFRNELIDILENYNPQSQTIIRGKSYPVDTLNAYIPGPGCQYSHIRIEELPIEAHILKVDLQNPYTYVKTFLGKNTIDGLERISDACNRYTDESSDAFAGINGDFFNIKAHNELPIGAPRGGCISEGVVQREPRSIDWAFAAIDYNNLPIIDNLEFEGNVVSFKAPIRSYNFYDVNLPRTDCFGCDMTFYNEFAGGSTRMDENANIQDKLKTEVFFKKTSDDPWHVNKSITCTVTRVIKDTKGNNKLLEGEVALSGIDDAKVFLDGITVGQKLKLKLSIKTADGKTPDIKEMIGGNTLLMKNGELDPTNFSDGYNNVLYPRTGAGCSADGRYLFLIAIDGRQKHSRGVYTDEMCDILRNMGATDAVGFDGGGSTEMVVNHEVMNQPSDGHERAVTNGWLLKTKTPNDGKLTQLNFNYWTKAMLQEGRIELRTLGYNQYNVLIDKDIPASYTCSTELGRIENGVLIVDGTQKKGTVTANYQGLKVTRYLNLSGDDTSVDKIKETNTTCHLFKVPNSKLFQLSYNNNEPKTMQFWVFNANGVKQMEGSAEFTNSHTFDFSELNQGIYILHVKMNGEIHSFKLIIN